jgi:hypothetical protein
MRDSALAQMAPFLIACGEGRVPWLYLDQSKPAPIVTTAIGCALFTLEACLALDWRDSQGMPALSNAVQAAWLRVRSHPELAPRGGGAFEGLTSIRLTDAAITALVAQRAGELERVGTVSLPSYADAPDAAQVGAMRLWWATGANGFASRWPKFCAAFNAGDWSACAEEDTIPSIEKQEPGANELLSALFRSLVP